MKIITLAVLALLNVAPISNVTEQVKPQYVSSLSEVISLTAASRGIQGKSVHPVK
ncbi:hypothetical protein OPW41_04485 [Vibrio europaeus]|uniref:Uncharacterized protein n=1 Tax=Vibrio europaeus TaxID=300876 RepID=A0AAE7B1M1_9VIBR|nr:hypothetical protein [Vibrio europaeus]MDC5705123.1 hypothetical protein [Vibrio europaeus]MDC5710402.1 hypothetical protein [Vibrio europaeus]MDC5715492.1 hypothetical protein [Vibrio europaeus]MDC5719653.1 hypothetical protein [Vibrio europaeus]MDC5724459.1 hypothetical protein [Vibrio europaeus]